MIDTKSLRRGNWINAKFQTEDFNFQVKGIFEDYVLMDKNISYNENTLYGIPLTPNILEKCGFTYDRGRFNEWWTLGIVDIFNLDFKGELTLGFWDTKIKYLHQLQNHYYLLTGKEINIQL